MANKDREINPIAFIAIGVCFMGSGVALFAALQSRGSSGVGIGLMGVGLMFLLIGVARQRRTQ